MLPPEAVDKIWPQPGDRLRLDFIRRPGQTDNGVIQELIELWKRQMWETTRVPLSVEADQGS